MAKVGIFFGSDTGNTEKVAQQIQQVLGTDKADIYDIAKSTKEDIAQYSFLLFGIPTWYYGESQCDWDDFFPNLEQVDFTNKTVAIFGCGDQEDYAEYFCDAMGTMKDMIQPLGAKIVGNWSTAGYQFESSKSLIDESHFIGLAIDEDRQADLTQDRITQWVTQVKKEMEL